MATLKTERFSNSLPLTSAAANLIIFDYIESFYNAHRCDSSLGCRSPPNFEKEIFPLNQYN